MLQIFSLKNEMNIQILIMCECLKFYVALKPVIWKKGNYLILFEHFDK